MILTADVVKIGKGSGESGVSSTHDLLHSSYAREHYREYQTS